MLEVSNLAVGYGSIQVLYDVSFVVTKGEIVALLGGNGAGKTSTLRSIVGILTLWEGRILFEGNEINDLKTPAIVSLGIAYVPEGKSVFPKMTVRENLELAANSPPARAAKAKTLNEVLTLFPLLKKGNKLKQIKMFLKLYSLSWFRWKQGDGANGGSP